MNIVYIAILCTVLNNYPVTSAYSTNTAAAAVDTLLKLVGDNFNPNTGYIMVQTLDGNVVTYNGIELIK